MIIRLLKWLAVLFLLQPAACPAWDNLGRLFTTPEQRERIDEARFSSGNPAGAVPEPRESSSRPWIFNGVLVQQDSVQGIWINGRQYSGEVLLRPDGSILLTLPASGLRVRLKPGQGVDPQTGRILQPWEARAIRSRKPDHGNLPAEGQPEAARLEHAGTESADRMERARS